MSYDREKIFKQKTNKELYKIFSGNTHLPIIASALAKKELENRNFNFNNIQAHEDARKLKSLTDDETSD